MQNRVVKSEGFIFSRRGSDSRGFGEQVGKVRAADRVGQAQQAPLQADLALDM